MSMRLSEVHPSLVHFPIAFLPAAIGADALGRVTHKRELYGVGRWCIGAAAVSAAVAGLFGLIAQEEVQLDDEGKDMLKTHRTLNLVALGSMTAMAIVRRRARRPSLGYLLAGVGLMAAVTYSAYLGGELVYAKGAGVAPARGIGGDDPELRGGDLSRVARTAVRHLKDAISHTASDLARGDIAPKLRPNGASSR